ncbi:MAG: hypothetical protein K1000chlam3_01454 [Chlamydiae bacterium]|nr:hypothetical protein [Chlamydiota bacterium]
MTVLTNQSILSSSLELQKQLSELYFESSEKTRKLVDIFTRCLKEEDQTTTFHRSSEGSTGHTYLCSMPSYLIPEEKITQSIGLVLKWQNSTLCAIEKLGAQIFQHFGLNAPKIHPFSENEAKKIMDSARKIDEKLGSMVNGLPLVAMPRIFAVSLTDIIKNGKLKQLSLQDQELLLKKFGQITLLDLLIGNNDRFISFIPDAEKKFNELSSLNGGNVLIEFEAEDSSIRLKDVYPIDNCTAIELLEKKPIEEEENYDFSLFSEEGEEEGEEEGPQFASQPSSKKKDLIAEFNAVFRSLIQDQDTLCKHFEKNLKKEILECNENIDDYREILSLIPVHYKAGMDQFLQKIRQNPSYLEKLENSMDTKKMIELISRNLKALKELS